MSSVNNKPPYFTKKKALHAALALLGAGTSTDLLAAACPSTISSAITTSCTLLGGASLVVTNTGTIASLPVSQAVVVTGTVGSLSNS